MPVARLFLITFFVCFIAKGQDVSQIGDSTALKVTGVLGARAIFYGAEGGEDRRQPFTYLLTGNLNANIYDFNIPLNFTFANQQFQFSQPFNQIGASPSYKWMKVHLGHRNLVWSQYTLAGHQMLGVGAEITPGKFRASIMYGRLQKSVPEDTTLLSLRRPAYKRTGYGVKVGYGTASDFVDLILFKAEDDENSLPNDSLPQTIRPGENVVAGINARTGLFKKKLTCYLDGAVSVFTLDKTLAIPTPESAVDNSLVSSFINTNASTQVYTAFKTGLQFQGRGYGLNTQLQRIDSDYRSMGLYFINNDVLAYSIQPNFSVWRSKLRFSGGITFQRDNLNDKKLATTKRTIPQVNVAFSPSPKLNFIATYTSLTSLMEEGSVPLDNVFKQDQRNPIYSVTASYVKSDTIRSHSITLFGNRSELVDNNLMTREFSQYVGNTINATYSFSQLQQFYGFYASYNYNDLETFNGRLPGQGFSVGGNKAFWDQTWSLRASYSYSQQDELESQSIVFGSSYQMKKHQVGLNATYLKTQLITGPFNEFTGFVNYRVRF